MSQKLGSAFTHIAMSPRVRVLVSVTVRVSVASVTVLSLPESLVCLHLHRLLLDLSFILWILLGLLGFFDGFFGCLRFVSTVLWFIQWLIWDDLGRCVFNRCTRRCTLDWLADDRLRLGLGLPLWLWLGRTHNVAVLISIAHDNDPSFRMVNSVTSVLGWFDDHNMITVVAVMTVVSVVSISVTLDGKVSIIIVVVTLVDYDDIVITVSMIVLVTVAVMMRVTMSIRVDHNHIITVSSLIHHNDISMSVVGVTVLVSVVVRVPVSVRVDHNHVIVVSSLIDDDNVPVVVI